MSVTSSVNVLGKASAILDCLAVNSELTPGQVADQIREPRSTVYRLLGSLREIGLVESGGGRGTYRLGLRLFSLGSVVVTRFDEHAAARPVMERIHELTGETIFLCVRREYEAVCIARLEGRRVQSLAMRLGGTLPLHSGGAPRVLLAYEPREFWSEYIAALSPLEPFTPTTPTTSADLFPLLESARTDGYAISDGDVTEGIAAIGAPIFDHSGAIRAALSMSGVKPAILGETFESNRDLILSGASEISGAMGYQPNE